MPCLYILRARLPVEVATLEEWYAWFAAFGGQRIVGRTELGPNVVYTAFQGLDVHRPCGPSTGEGHTFETLVLGGPLGGSRYSYSRWFDAESGHRAWVARVSASARQPPLRRGAVDGAAHLASAGSAQGFCDPVTHRTRASL